MPRYKYKFRYKYGEPGLDTNTNTEAGLNLRGKYKVRYKYRCGRERGKMQVMSVLSTKIYKDILTLIQILKCKNWYRLRN